MAAYFNVIIFYFLQIFIFYFIVVTIFYFILFIKQYYHSIEKQARSQDHKSEGGKEGFRLFFSLEASNSRGVAHGYRAIEK